MLPPASATPQALAESARLLSRRASLTPSTRCSAAPRIVFWTLAVLLPLGFVGIFFLWPVFALIATGFTADGHFDFSGVPQTLNMQRNWLVLGNTLTQATLATALAVLLGIPAAFVLYRLEFPGRKLLRAIITVPFVLPAVVVGAAFSALYGAGGMLHWLGLERSLPLVIMGLAFFNVTVVARTVGGYWAKLDPRQEQAARTLGASPARVFSTITLPALAPAIASAAALVFLFCATSFAVVLLLGGRKFANIETEIYQLTVQFLDLRTAAVLSVVQLLIVALALAIAALLKRFGASQVQRLNPGTRPLRRQDAPVVALFAGTLLLLHLLPIGALLWRSFSAAGSGKFTLVNYLALVDPPPASPLHGSALRASILSLEMAGIATLLALTAGLLVSLVVSRVPRQRFLKRAIACYDSAIMLPLGISAVTLGFGLLITMQRPFGIGFDLRTSAVLIPIAQALVALPLVVRMLTPGLRAINPRLRQAATMLGASPLRVLGTIDLPLLGRTLGLALGFAFAVSLGEFGATAFLVRPEAETLPVAISTLLASPDPANYGTALAAAVLLGALAAGIMLLAEQWRFNGEAGGNW